MPTLQLAEIEIEHDEDNQNEDCEDNQNTNDVRAKMRAEAFTPEEEAENRQRIREGIRAAQRFALREERYQELYEEEYKAVMEEMARGFLPPPPPRTVGTLLCDGASQALGYASDFGNAYLTANTAKTALGVLTTGAICCTKKGAAAAVYASQTAAAVVASVNPVTLGIGIGVGGTVLFGYGLHKYTRSEKASKAPSVEVNINIAQLNRM
jgi:hypothetical protein